MANQQVNVQFIPNGRGGQYLVFQNHKFVVKRRRGTSVHWNCAQKNCHATVNTKDNILTSYRDQHNHASVENRIAVDSFLANLKDLVRKDSKPIPSLYQEELSGLRVMNPDIIAEVPIFDSVRPALYRSRAKDIPHLPATRSAIHLPDAYTKTHANDNFLLFSHGDHDKILTFATDENLRLLSEADVYYCDGTFDKCPGVFTQLYTIHAFVQNKMCPLVYGLLPDKKQSTYERFFENVKNVAASKNIVLDPVSVFTDFESAAQNAIKMTFQNAILKGCYFHFSQSVWRKVQKLGMVTEYKDNPDIGRLVRRAIALPLVPVDCVSDVWWQALEDAPPGVEQFTDYMTSYWVEGDHGRTMWNHFTTEGPRTTNHVEGWHRKLSCLENHPNIFKIIEFLKKNNLT